MAKPIRSVLVADVDDRFFRRFAPLLARSNFDVDRVPHARNATPLISAIGFDILVFGFPTTGIPASQLIQIVRAEGSPCRRSAVLFMAPDSHLEEAKSVAAAGYTRVVSEDVADIALQTEISSLLRVAPRLSARIVIRLEVELSASHTEILSQTENVSLGGMLVRTTRAYPMDTPVRFELCLRDSDRPVAGSGAVVRHATDDRRRPVGMGVKFVRFDGNGAQRLQRFLNTPDEGGKAEPENGSGRRRGEASPGK